jgi:hypothetical protein
LDTQNQPRNFYISLKHAFLYLNTYILFTQGDGKGAAALERAKSLFPRRAQFPKAGEISRLGMLKSLHEAHWEMPVALVGPLAWDQLGIKRINQGRCTALPPSCPPLLEGAVPLHLSAQSATLFDRADHGDQLAKRLPNRA